MIIGMNYLIFLFMLCCITMLIAAAIFYSSVHHLPTQGKFLLSPVERKNRLCKKVGELSVSPAKMGSGSYCKNAHY